MFFVKAAFWIALVLLLLPSNGHERFELYTTAQRTISDIGGFCTRNPDVCEKTSAFFKGIVQKLKSTTDSIEEMLQAAGVGAKPKAVGDEYSALGDRDRNRAAMRPATTSSLAPDTLTVEDKRPQWQGPDQL
jgi:hypothetical protein